MGCTDPAARVVAYGPGDIPAIIMRRIGRGAIVLAGDTAFCMNKNLEREGGQPFEGLRENADFWRWFIGDLTGREKWYPSPASTQPGER